MNIRIVTALIATFGLSCGASASVLTGTLTNGLTAYYSFNGNYNDSVSGNNLTQTTGTSFVAGRIGNSYEAIAFNSSTAYLQSINPISITGNNDRTISFWCNLINTNSYARIGWGDDYQAGQSVLQASVQGIWFTTWYNDVTANTSNPLNTSEWIMYTIGYDGNTKIASCYINGLAILSTSFYPYGGPNLAYTLDTASSQLRFETFNGCYLSDLAIYNRSLSSIEVSQLYSAQVIPEPSTYGLFGIGAVGMLMAIRRKKTA